MATTWLDSKNLQLCISYYRQSVDSTIGNQQNGTSLWAKIAEDYHENWQSSVAELREKPRTVDGLSSRFQKLKPRLKYWGACLAHAQRNPESGCNVHDEVNIMVFFIS